MAKTWGAKGATSWNVGGAWLIWLLKQSDNDDDDDRQSVKRVTQNVSTAYVLFCFSRIFSSFDFVSDIAVFVLTRDVKLQPTNQPTIFFW